MDDMGATWNSTEILSQSFIFSKASDIIPTYSSFYSPYLFGSYAKGTATPSSDVGIVVFTHKFDFEHIGGAHMDLETAFGKKVDLLVSPPKDFVEKIQKYWIPIPLIEGKSTLYMGNVSKLHVVDSLAMDVSSPQLVDTS
jgi:predicted nucleotidyltransferase